LGKSRIPKRLGYSLRLCAALAFPIMTLYLVALQILTFCGVFAQLFEKTLLVQNFERNADARARWH